jgi:hypothetical protein
MNLRSEFERLKTFAILAGVVAALASPPALASPLGPVKSTGKTYRQHKRECLKEDPKLKSKPLQACIKRKAQAVALNQPEPAAESKIISD